MSDYIFDNIDYDENELWVVKEFFNSLNTITFSRVVGYLKRRTNYGGEFHSCEFPENIEEDEEVFNGVRFRCVDKELVIGEEEFNTLLNEACINYVNLYPEKKAELEGLGVVF